MSKTGARSFDERASRVHRAATVMLGYMNPACYYRQDGLDYSWFLKDDPRVQGGLPRLRRGGVDVATLSFGVNTEPIGPQRRHKGPLWSLWRPLFEGAEQVKFLLKHLDSLHRIIEANSDRMAVALSVADVRRINRQGKMAVLLHLTGAWVDHDLAMLRSFQRLGIRSIHVAIEGLEGVADASDGPRVAKGLTPFGRELVREMNRLGMVIDVSHASDEAAREALEISRYPVIASHSNVRALCPVNRNLPDDLIKGIARGGGVIGVHFSSGMITSTVLKKRQAAGYYRGLIAKTRALYRKYPNPYGYLAHRYSYDEAAADFEPSPELRAKLNLPPLSKLCEHIDYIVQLVGIDHVGVGSDYDLGDIPVALDDASKLPNLTAELLRRGYSVSEVNKIWGANFLRVYREVIGS